MDVLIYLTKSAAILGIFYLVYILLLRKETHFGAHRIFLLTGLIGSFVLPLWYFTKTIFVEVVETSSTTGESGLVTMSQTSIPEVTQPIDWWNVAFYIYILGALVLLLRFIIQLTSLLIMLRKSDYHRSNGFNFVCVCENIAPFSFFSYIVYNPKLHSEEELNMILKHEQVHAFQWHSADIILANVLIMLQWINPLAWLYKKSVEENLEFLADHATAAKVPSKIEYQMALVKVSSAYFTPALTTNFYKSFIKKRIIMLNKRTSKQHNLLKLTIVVPFIALFLWSFNVQEVREYSIIPSEGTQSDSSEIAAELAANEAKVTSPVLNIANEASKLVNKSVASENLAIASISEVPMNAITVEVAKELAQVSNLASKFEFKITKNTTNTELDKLKAKLKAEHGVDMSYTVKRNQNQEIISLDLQYSGNDSNGNYSISDDEGIADFVFYLNDDGKSGFYSEKIEARRAEKVAQRAYARAKIQQEREEMREEIIVEREEVREKMKEEREKMRDRVRQQRKKVLIESDTDGQGLFDDEEEKTARIHIIQEIEDEEDGGNVTILRSNGGQLAKVGENHSEHSIIIDSKTTDATLAKIKSRLAAKGITFKYSKIKRNSNGKLTSIKITVDGESSKQTIYAKSDDGDPIDELLIEIN